jgi:hypothetical protein
MKFTDCCDDKKKRLNNLRKFNLIKGIHQQLGESSDQGL